MGLRPTALRLSAFSRPPIRLSRLATASSSVLTLALGSGTLDRQVRSLASEATAQAAPSDPLSPEFKLQGQHIINPNLGEFLPLGAKLQLVEGLTLIMVPSDGMISALCRSEIG